MVDESKTLVPAEDGGEILLYQAQEGDVELQVMLEDETVWLTIGQMAGLFQVDKSGISRHIKNIYETGELQRDATVANFATVRQEGAMVRF